jgi:hypothetical protein
LKEIKKAAQTIEKQLKSQGKKVHLLSLKDFTSAQVSNFKEADFSNFYQFQIQPNMVLEIKPHWHSIDDYVANLNKKYRDQYKRVRKKGQDIEKRKLEFEEISKLEAVIYDLYLHVAKNAPFNTFLLNRNHHLTSMELF